VKAETPFLEFLESIKKAQLGIKRTHTIRGKAETPFLEFLESVKKGLPAAVAR